MKMMNKNNVFHLDLLREEENWDGMTIDKNVR